MVKAILLSFTLLLLTGCVTSKPIPTSNIDTKGITSQQVEKDEVVLEEAGKIEEKFPEAIQHTQRQVQAVMDAPAKDIEIAFRKLQEENQSLRESLKKSQNQALRDQARYLTFMGIAFGAAFAISMVFGGGLVGAAKTFPLLLLSAGCFGMAQLISHPWFLPVFAICVLVAVIYAAWYIYDRHKEGRLKTSLSKKVDTLKTIIPVLDEAKKNASKEIREILDLNVFGKLSRAMDKDEKRVIKELQGELKNNS